MKNLFFLLLPLFIISCKGVEQHRASIDELSAKWDAATKEITDHKTMVSSDLTNYTQALAALQPDEATKAKMKPEEITAMDASHKVVTDALNAYPTHLKTISDFEATWNEKAEEVTALKDGLAAGKMEGDVNAKITELNAMVATANENLTAWKAAYATIKSTVETAFASINQTQGTIGNANG
ncbi:MAG TPA: hypothetical protein VEA37_04945 [Flavobacterium sp.]|nr:hypothetical protein [Flavobacterium sp.]